MKDLVFTVIAKERLGLRRVIRKEDDSLAIMRRYARPKGVVLVAITADQWSAMQRTGKWNVVDDERDTLFGGGEA